MRTARHTLMLLLLMGGIAHAEAPPRAQLDATLKKLEASKKNQTEIKEKLEQTQEELARIQSQVTGLAQRLQVSERRVSAQEASLAKITAELAAKQTEFAARRADYTDTILYLLRAQSLPPSAFFTDPEKLQEMVRTASVLEATNRAIAAKATMLRRDLDELQRLQKTADQRRIETQREQAALQLEQETMAKTLEQRQKLNKKLNTDYARTEAQIAELSRSSQSLQELIRKLEESARASRRGSNSTETLRTFAGRKDGLRAPVSGALLHRFGERKNDNETYRGLVFRTRAKAAVVAPYDGEVVFTGPFRDYGRMVLIKHQGGYISLIAGLGSIDAALNQTVSRGEPIGAMPDIRSAEAYVELRDKDAKPIDPGDWFANVDDK